ncbi:MAG TPA: pyruvate kinase [Acholeplasmataceae bacterium]|nr:pyruvate kinase [Acholeplasmataceae bacterium]
MEKTKLVGTMGPASENIDVLRELIKAGLNVARMNFSHGDHEEHFGRLSTVRKLNEELGTNVGIMLDTKGPEMRTHEFDGGKLLVQKDQELKVYFEQVLGNSEQFSINYPGLYDDVSVGTIILIDDGYLQTEVIEKNEKGRYLVIKAKNTHQIKNRRGVNVPNTLINMPFLSEKDREDILFGIKHKVDFIAASFVQRASDVEQIRELLVKNGTPEIQIISKIENQEGVDNIDEIIEASDGIMYARGDLGVEILPEDLPHIQKMVVEKCRQANKLIIVATQMVESMQQNPVPTRAEVSDVANAVFEGADSVMLSGEMAAGNYPVEAVKMMKRIVKANEKYVDYDQFLFPLYEREDNLENLSFMTAAAATAHDIKAVVASNNNVSHTLSKYRLPVPIVALLSKEEATKANVYFGVNPLLDHSDKAVLAKLTQLGLEKGDKFIQVFEDSLKIKTV